MFKVSKKIICKSLFFCLVLVLFSISELNAQQFRLNSDAVQLSCDCYELTQGNSSLDRNKAGSAWSLQELDLSEAFELNFKIYLGDREGADGMAFVLQQNTSLDFVSFGGGLGYRGISQSLGLLFDTHRNSGATHNDPIDPDGMGELTSDHISLHRDGNFIHGYPTDSTELVKAANTADLEDGKEKHLQITWDPNTNNYLVKMDSVVYINYIGDIINDIFGGDPIVTWGFTGSTGNSYNQHYFCSEALNFMEVMNRDTTCLNTSYDFSAFDNIYNEEVGSWSWDFGDGNILLGSGTTITVPTHTYTTAGDFTAILMYDNASGTCSQEQEFEINVPEESDLSISASSTDICYNKPVDITIGGTGNFTLTTLPATFSETLINGVNTVNLKESTMFTVSTEVGFCVVTDNVEVIVRDSSTFSLDQPQDVCEGDSLELSISNSTSPTYTWQKSIDNVAFGTGVTSGTNLTLKESLGTHYVRVLQTNGSCTDTSNVVSFDVNAYPVIDLSATDASCYYDSTTLTISTGGVPFVFSAEPNYQGTLLEGDNEILITDSTEFIITAKLEGCKIMDSITVDIIEQENIFIEDVFDNICEGIAETFGAGIRIDGLQTDTNSIRWQVSHDNISYLDTLGTNTFEQLSVLNVGDYYFRAIYDHDGCSDTSNIEFFDVDNPVNLSLPTDLDICEGDRAVFTVVNDGTLSTMTIPDQNIALTSGENNIFIDENTSFIVTANDGGCLKTDSFKINYIEDIDLDLSGGKIICEGEDVTLSLDQDKLTNYQWQVSHDFVNYEDTLASTPSITLVDLTAGGYFLKVKHLNNNSCESESNIALVGVKPMPELVIEADDQVCLGEVANLELLSTGILTEDYSGVLIQGNNPLNLKSDTKIIFKIDLNGCIEYDTVEIAVIIPLTLELDTVADKCDGEDVFLNAQQKGLSNYQWQVSHDGIAFEDTLTSTDSFILSGLNVGNYYFRVKHDGVSCESISNIISFEIKPIPELFVMADLKICEGEQLSLLVSNEGNLSHDFSKEIISGPNSLTLTETTQITFETELNGCINRDTIEIEVVPQIVLLINEVSDKCFGEEVSIGTQVGLSNYQWQVSHDGISFKDTLSSNASFTLSSLNVGDYYFIVSHVSNGCNNTSDTIFFKVNPIPELIVTADAQICERDNVTVTISNDGMLSSDYTNTIFKEGENIFGLNITTEIAFATELNGCINNDTVTIIVIPSVDLIINPIDNICFGDEASLSVAPTDLSSYQWQVSDDGVTFTDTLSSNANFTLSGLGARDYYFRTFYDDGFCTHISDTINFGVIDMPNLSVTTSEDEICSYDIAQVDIQTTGLFNVTSSPQVNTSDFVVGVNNIEITENTTFIAIAGAPGCEEQEELTILFIPKVDFSVSDVLDVCEGTNVDFSIDDVSITSVDWESHNGNGDFTSSLDNSPSQILTLTPNNYNYRSLYSHDGCVDTSANVVSFDVNATPELSIVADPEVCFGDLANLNVSHSGELSSDYEGEISIGDNSLNLMSTTLINFIATEKGCENKGSANIIVNQPIDLKLGEIEDVCLGTDVELETSQIGLTNYQWQVSHDGVIYEDTLSSNASFTLTDLNVGDYYFKMSHINNGCPNESDTIDFMVIEEPLLMFLAPETVCFGNEVKVTINTVNNFTVISDPIIQGELTEGMNSLTLSEDTKFEVTYGPIECERIDFFSIRVIDPFLEITESNSGTGDDFTIAQGEEFTIDVNTNTDGISWFINEEESTEFMGANSQSFSVEDNSTISVDGMLNGCKVNDQLIVTVTKKLGLPKLLTPNGNGSNDVFEIKNLESFNPSSVTIYNRWGSVMYKTRDNYEAWDGTYNGTYAPDGTYYYVIDFIDNSESVTGYFTLMK